MSSLIVVIQWWGDVTEYVTLNTDEPLEVGDEMQTNEYWKEEKETVKYNVVCTAYKINGSTHTINLSYSEKNNPSIQGRDVRWGESSIVVKIKEQVATAEWLDNDKDSEFNRTATKCTVFNGEHTNEREGLLYNLISRLDRSMQTKFRDILLNIDGRCAISGETTREALEAAHIVDVYNNGTCDPHNGILLRADLHRLFDKNLLLINQDGTISFDSQVSGAYKNELSDRTLPAQVLSRVSSALSARLTGSK